MKVHQPTHIVLDGKPCVVDEPTNLADLIGQLGHGDADVATAVNGQFVARAARAERVLRAGDSVTLFQAIVGG